ncbi:MAG: efflux RND transporter periplasmic adaptor subunit [Elusimicrobia bacterium]|nr:efflux RND transporter periplasmic adaptor subunit [Elusimicrobiota bacterium]
MDEKTQSPAGTVSADPKKLNWQVKAGALALVSIAVLGLNFWVNPKKYARSVQVVTAEKKDLQLKVLATGNLGFKNSVEIKSEIAESVIRKYVKEGDRVQAGDILLKLSSAKQKISFEKETNRIKDLQTETVKARKELAIQRDLFQKQAVARSAVEKAESDLAKSESNYNVAKQEFELERKNLEKTLIVAESSGIVLVDMVQSQPSVEQNKVLFVVGTPGQFQLNAKIDELNIQSVFVGARSEVNVDAFPGTKLPGVVSKIDTQAESGSFSKIGVKIEIQDVKGLELRPNLTAQGYILGNVIKEVIWLPMEAIKTEGEERTVFVVSANNKAQKRTVVTGRTANNQVEISEGIQPGERVVITETDFLRNGETIKIAEPGAELRPEMTAVAAPVEGKPATKEPTDSTPPEPSDSNLLAPAAAPAAGTSAQ